MKFVEPVVEIVAARILMGAPVLANLLLDQSNAVASEIEVGVGAMDCDTGDSVGERVAVTQPHHAGLSKKKKKSVLPRLLRIPAGQRTPLLPAVVGVAQICRAGAVRLQTEAVQNNENMRHLTKTMKETVLADFKTKLSP